MCSDLLQTPFIVAENDIIQLNIDFFFPGRAKYRLQKFNINQKYLHFAENWFCRSYILLGLLIEKPIAIVKDKIETNWNWNEFTNTMNVVTANF